jgi:DNA-binding transcriptional ArsR family regulator
MLRIHLTAGDLLRTRFADQPAPLLETGLAVAALQRREPVFGTWRSSAAARLPRAARPLLELIPPSATSPLFLDPVTAHLGEGLEMVQATSSAFVRRELRRLAAVREPGPYLRSLAAGDRDTWRDLDLALRTAYHHLVEEAWPRIVIGFHAELTWRSRLIAELGVQAALCTLHPSISWNGTVMQIRAPYDLDFHPAGAGLTLMPSPLWTGRAMVAPHSDGSVLIVYPAMTPLPLIGEIGEIAGNALAGLLGHTRAAILELLLIEHTTSEIADQLGISAATVSGHTKVLRAAGLIVTSRAGKSVLHSLTPLGTRLLNACHSPSPTPIAPTNGTRVTGQLPAL